MGHEATLQQLESKNTIHKACWTFSRSLSLSASFFFSLSLSLFLVLSTSLSLALFLSFFLSLSLSFSLYPSLSVFLSLYLSRSLSLSSSLSLSLSASLSTFLALHTHTHIYLGPFDSGLSNYLWSAHALYIRLLENTQKLPHPGQHAMKIKLVNLLVTSVFLFVQATLLLYAAVFTHHNQSNAAIWALYSGGAQTQIRIWNIS
jgi:hypothetical protein